MKADPAPARSLIGRATDFFGSMAGRVFLVLAVGVLASAALTWSLADQQRRQSLQRFGERRAAERVADLVAALEPAEPAMRASLSHSARRIGLYVLPAGESPRLGKVDENLTAAIVSQIGVGKAYETDPDACRPPRRPPPFPRADGDDSPRGLRGRRPAPCRAIVVPLSDGETVRMTARPASGALFTRRPHFAWTFWLMFLSLIGLIAYFASRMSTEPVRRLGAAAAALGRDIERPPLAETGPTEVRRAAAAFNAMQARIRKQVTERTHMLAAITHDLQTPLTRLRLRLEKVPDEALRERLVSDLAAMQALIREGLDFARSIHTGEPMQRVDLDSLVESIVDDAVEMDQDVALSGAVRASVLARPQALKRVISNLVENAVKYGGHARLSVAREGGLLVLRIADSGPGMPEDQLESVFDPFVRLETSRSRETGGVGLGLTIARTIAEQHGGAIELKNRAEGGLEAILTLPAVGAA